MKSKGKYSVGGISFPMQLLFWGNKDKLKSLKFIEKNLFRAKTGTPEEETL